MEQTFGLEGHAALMPGQSGCAKPTVPTLHPIHPFATEFGSKDRIKFIPSEPKSHVADLGSTRVQRVLDVTQRKKGSDLKQHCQAGAFLGESLRKALGRGGVIPRRYASDQSILSHLL